MFSCLANSKVSVSFCPGDVTRAEGTFSNTMNNKLKTALNEAGSFPPPSTNKSHQRPLRFFVLDFFVRSQGWSSRLVWSGVLVISVEGG